MSALGAIKIPVVSESDQLIALVMPVWNDSARLAKFGPKLAAALQESTRPVRWIVADDGSTDIEKAKVKALVESFRVSYPSVEAMFFDQRSCKGGAVYSAWDACPEATWLAFVDCDGAVSAHSMVCLMEKAASLGAESGCIGVRHDSEETPLQRPLGRLISFYIFSTLVHVLTGVRFEDTQCGAKVIPAKGYRHIAGRLKERGFIFDVELLLALGKAGYQIKEQRIPWSEVPGGKVNPLRDAWTMIGGLLRIRKRSRAGLY